MNDEELNSVEELTREGMTRELLVQTIENPSIQTFDRMMEELNTKTLWPYTVDDFLKALFKRVIQQPVSEALSIVTHLSKYDAMFVCESDVLRWLKDIDYEMALPFLNQMVAEQGKFAGAAQHIQTFHTMEEVYKGDFEAALNDESPDVAAYAADRIASRLIAIGDRAAFIRFFTLPYISFSQTAWDVGYKKIYAAVDALMEAAPREQDPETLRAMLWSLSVLRHKPAIGLVRTFLQHEHPLVASMARDALERLTKT